MARSVKWVPVWLLAALTPVACSRRAPEAQPRIAILPVENLTGDASLDWLTKASSSILADELFGTGGRAFTVPAIRDAYANRATGVVHGFVTKPGANLKFEWVLEDLASHKMVRELTAEGPLLAAARKLTEDLGVAAVPYSTANEEAIAAISNRDFERAVSIDPDFGAAWVGWVKQLAADGQTAEAEQIAGRALARASLKSEVQRTELRIISAELHKDYKGRAAAFEQMERLAPNDVNVLRAAAEAQNLARNFAAAAVLYRKILAIDPTNAPAMNALGYAEASAGRLAEAKAAFDVYGKQPGQATNALDSRGEAEFMNGDFKPAEADFLAAYTRDPRFLDGKPLAKAAYARWLAGDLAGADGLMNKYLALRAQTVRDFEEAYWLYASGRRDRAIEKLSMAAPAAAPETRALVQKQLTVWKTNALPDDLKALQSAYEALAPPADGLVRVLYAAALARAEQKDAARELLRQWPLPGQADPFTQSLAFAQLPSLRKQLGL